MWKMLTDVKGEGAPLVLVGGGLTGYLSWVPHQEKLAGSRKVIRAQLLAVQLGLEGKTVPPDYSVEMESGALAEAIDGVEPRPVDLVGWSYGAAISLAYAIRHPERVRTLTLIEPPAFWVLDVTGRWDAQSRRESEEIRALYTDMKARGAVTEDELATFLHQAGVVPSDQRAQDFPSWPTWAKHRRSLLAGPSPWAYHDTKDRLAAFERPVLLVKGTGSSHFLHRITDALSSALPRAQVIELPGGHSPQIVAMDDFLKRLAAFQSN